MSDPVMDLPLPGEPFVLRDIRVPRPFAPDAGDLEPARLDIGIAEGTIRFVAPSAADTPSPWRSIRLDRTMAWPCFVEPHSHLDSSHIWPRSPNPDGSFASAATAIINDRIVHWTADDMRRRMDFGLRCAHAHGIKAMRTHLASQNEQIEERWEIFSEVRAQWAGRIALQAVPLISTDALADESWMQRVIAVVRRHDGVLGAFAPLSPLLDAQLNRLFDLAQRHDLALDFHADENADPGSDVLRRIAGIAKQHGGTVPVQVGHCCSLAVQDDEVVDRTLDLVAEANLSIVSLPSCNLYLQGRGSGRTPRWRGVTLLHEMAARGIPVSVGGDNCRDPYHPYGDFDPLESFRDAVRIAHLDHPMGDWPATVTMTPDALFGKPRTIAPGDPADLVLFRAASMNELLARRQARRTLIRGGRFETPELPDYSELD